MRLLNARTHLLEFFLGDPLPGHAILSHTWGDDEVTFQDIINNTASQRKAYEKLLGTCQQALRDNYEWVWIDTCCIDKSSSSELQESINSMYRWYSEADVCYAYLSDVDDAAVGWDAERFGESRWWTRGWTLRT